MASILHSPFSILHSPFSILHSPFSILHSPFSMAHFLKRLELNGFKSFANKTVLEFPAGIVAIVGPNGSGKSNVVDSLRWLLGERDAKNLRGGKVEDLIFAGTQKRARVGMATASLFFENSNKFFPVDFEEVVISRQISRGGDSKYFLNKAEILLRDLVDFLAKARLGSRGLVIIGQGDSDLFIRSTPMERREMIEEILGLREYQLKKADAERRLKNSRINLDKTKALTEEILPHLRSLKRQTNRWEKRSELAEELKQLENLFFGSQLHELGAKLKSIGEILIEDKRQFEILEQNRREAERRQQEIEASQPEEKKELAKVKDEIRALMENRSELQKDLGRLEAQVEMAAAPRRESGHDAEQLLELIRKVRTELELAVQEEDERGVLAAIEGIIEEIDNSLEEKSGRKRVAVPDSFGRELEKVRADLSALEKNLAALREREQGFEASQEGFYRTFKEAVAAVQQAKNHIGEWERQNREHISEKERLEFRRGEVIHQIEQAGRRADEFETNSGNISRSEGFTEITGLEQRIFRLRGDLASIGEIDEALMKEAKDTESRYEFLTKESEDLEKAVADLVKLIGELAEKIKSEFDRSLGKINDEFQKFFELMFGGGSAKLKVLKVKTVQLTAEDGEKSAGEAGEEPEREVAEEEDGGIEVDVKLPRKKITSLDVLSGGERSLVGIAALFALVSVSPPPFLVLDEVDAPLDERNARRFAEMLREFSRRTQFIVVTHNRATMEAADILYGVTLAEDGTSKIVSLKFEE
ncbi:MAG: AAA family ATPase [Patescibacteria group bacterium]|nr:AAA family ATPase [Patescibacteria group bacterium]